MYKEEWTIKTFKNKQNPIWFICPILCFVSISIALVRFCLSFSFQLTFLKLIRQIIDHFFCIHVQRKRSKYFQKWISDKNQNLQLWVSFKNLFRFLRKRPTDWKLDNFFLPEKIINLKWGGKLKDLWNAHFGLKYFIAKI